MDTKSVLRHLPPSVFFFFLSLRMNYWRNTLVETMRVAVVVLAGEAVGEQNGTKHRLIFHVILILPLTLEGRA